MVELTDAQQSSADRIEGRCAEERGLTLNSLCASCKSGQVMRRRGKLDIMVLCHAGFEGGTTVPPDLAECTRYEGHAVPTLHEMTQVAVVVDGREGVSDKAYL